MKKIFITFLFVLLFTNYTHSITRVYADNIVDPDVIQTPQLSPEALTSCSGTEENCYQLLEPLPGGTGLLSGVSTTTGGTADQGLGGFMNFIFEIAIGVAGVLGVVMLTIYGFQYAANDKNINTFGVLRERISGVIMGLLLLLGIFIILKTINPDLLVVEPEIAVQNLSLDQQLALAEAGIDINSIKNVNVKDINSYVATSVNRSKYIANEYIPARDRALSNISNMTKILLTAQAQKEGFYPNSKSYRTNNPGNIHNYPGHEFSYPTLEDGIKAQYDLLKKIVLNTEPNYKLGKQNNNCGGFIYDGTLDKYLKIYTPDACNGSYLNFIIGYYKKENISVNGQMKVSEIFYSK